MSKKRQKNLEIARKVNFTVVPAKTWSVPFNASMNLKNLAVFVTA